MAAGAAPDRGAARHPDQAGGPRRRQGEGGRGLGRRSRAGCPTRSWPSSRPTCRGSTRSWPPSRARRRSCRSCVDGQAVGRGRLRLDRHPGRQDGQGRDPDRARARGPDWSERIIGQSHALEAISQRIRTARAKLEDPAAADRRVPAGRPERRRQDRDRAGPGRPPLRRRAQHGHRSTCPSTRKATRSRASRARRPATSATARAACSPRRSGAGPTASCCSTRSRRRTPTCIELFYQVFDKGMLEDGEGREIDFKNTVILLTSNVGTDTS